LDGHATETDKLNTSGSDLDDDGAADQMHRHKAAGGSLAASIAPKSATARTRTSHAPHTSQLGIVTLWVRRRRR
jgi:hypothetical protein